MSYFITIPKRTLRLMGEWSDWSKDISLKTILKITQP